MRKMFTSLIQASAFIFLLLTAAPVAHAQSSYCDVATSSSTSEWLTNVTFAGIDNTSGSSNYTDFTAISGTVSPGLSYPFSGTVAVNFGDSETITVFIDWDQSFTFEDSERYTIGTSCNSDGCVLTDDIDVPATALPGQTRMRVAMKYLSNSTDACDSYYFGEIEDYTINVTSGECTPPSFTYTVVNDCDAETYSVVADLTDFGSSTFITVYFDRSDDVPVSPATLIFGLEGQTVNLINDIPFGVTVAATISGSNPLCDLTRNWAQEYCHIDGEVCDAPLVVSELPFTDSGNTDMYLDDYDNNDVPENAADVIGTGSNSAYYITGDDVVYAYTPDSDGAIDIEVTGTGSWAGLYVFTGCPFELTVGYHNSSTAGTRAVDHLPVSADTTYYIVISTNASPQSTPYTLNITPWEDCEGTPTAGTVGEDFMVCAATAFDLVATDASPDANGLVYTWQSSPAGANTWTDVDGANTPTSTIGAGVTEETDFRLKAYCTASDATDYSDVVTVSINPVYTECYCIPAYSTACSVGDDLSNVTLAGESVGINNDTDCSEDGYADFTALPAADLAPGETYNLSASTTYGTPTSEQVKAWIDFNLNGAFEDDELIANSNGAGLPGGTGTFDFTVPEGLDAGNYRLRVRLVYGSGAPTWDACSSQSYGETQDYMVDIIDLAACSGTPEAGTAANDAMTVCGTIPFELSVDGASDPADGLTRNWQSSPAGANTWTDIDGANSATYTVSGGIDTSTDFRYSLTCSNSGESDVSNIVEVSINTNLSECFCIPEGTNASRYINNFSTSGGITDITNSGSGFSDGGYGDFTAMVAQAYAGDNLSITADITGGTAGVRVWVDWNQDGNFDTEEEVAYNSTSYGSSQSGTFMIPNDAMEGETRMRVVSHYLSSTGNVDPCATGFTNGEFEDYILDVVIPSCVGPSDLAVDTVTATTADITWSPNGSANAYTIAYGTPGFDPDSEGMTDTADGSGAKTLTDLNPGTTYEFYVRADCGGDAGSSSYMGPVQFTTECVTAIAPWSEDFENGGAIPNCWKHGADNNENWKFANTGSGNHIGNNGSITGTTPSGGYFAWVDDSSPDSEGTTLVSPFIDVSELSVPELTFYLISNNEGNSNVTFSVDVYDGAAWNDNVFMSNQNTADGGWEEITVDLSSLSITGSIQIRFVVDEPSNGDFYDDVAIDDISVHEQPSCPKPLDLTVNSFTTGSASLSWVAGGNETAWEVIYGENGFDAGTEGTTIAVSDTTVDLEGLDSDTSYDVYVRAMCSANDPSFWQGPAAFTTNCLATDIPFSQDFEAVTTPNIPNCGSLETNNGNDWETASVTSYGFNSTVLRNKYSSFGAGAVDAWYFTQGINMEAGLDYQISFKYGNGSSFYTEKLKVAYGTSSMGTAMTNELADYPNITDGSAELAEINFSVPEDGVYYFGFQSYSAENQLYVYVDDIYIDLAPTCLHVTDLSADSLTVESADVHWSAGGDETSWEVLYGETGFDTETEGTSVIVSDTTVSLTDLEASTLYDVYVRAICSENDLSAWEGPLTFRTTLEGGYCLPEGTNSARYIDNFSTTGGVSNITNENTGFSTGGFGDYTSMTVSQVQTQDVSFSEDFVGGTAGFRIWVDWNQDGTFDPVNEVAWNSTSYSGSHSGSFTVPLSALAGETRMRVVATYIPSDGDVDPCGSFSYGEFEDYTFEVIALDECAGTPDAGVADADDFMICPTAPLTLSVTGASTPASGLVSNWQSSPAGENDWTDIDGATAPTYVLANGISEATDFRYVVTCENSQETAVSNVISATINTNVTECYCIPEGTNTGRYIDSFVTTDGILNVNNDESGFSAGGYGDFTAMTVQQAAGDSVSFTANFEGGTFGFRIWVDWNQDGAFDTETEVAYNSSSYSSSHSGSFAVPADAMEGETRMRIVNNWGSTTASNEPCATGFGNGEFEDYTFNVSGTQTEWDCPDLQANIGDACDDQNADTENDMITEDCECVGTPIVVEFDCPDLQANIGDACDDQNADTENDMITADCECAGTPIVVEFDCPDLEANYGDACELADGMGVLNTDCECVAAPTCFNFTYYLTDHDAADGISSIYGVTLSGGVATMSYIATSDIEVHIAFNEFDNLIYAVSKHTNSYRTLDPYTGIWGPTVSLGADYGEITAAVFAPNGKMVFGSQNQNALFSVNVSTNVVSSYDTYSPVTGGDLAFGSDGMLYLATRSGNGLYQNWPNDVMSDVLIGNVPAKVTGMAITDLDELLVSAQGQTSLQLYNTTGSNIGSYTLELEGEAYTLRDGDMASGCNTGNEEIGDCDDFSTFYVDHGPNVSGSKLYGVTFTSSGIANMTYLATVPYEAHIAFNAQANVVYLVNVDGSFVRSYDVSTDVFTGDLMLVNDFVKITAAYYNADDELLYIGDHSTDEIYAVDLTTGMATFYADGPVSGGDIVIDDFGIMYLATRMGAALYDVAGGTANLIGGIGVNVTGMAMSNQAPNLMLSNKGSNMFTKVSAIDASVVSTYTAILNGSPFTMGDGDMASGCADEDAPTPPANPLIGAAEGMLTAYPNPTSGQSEVIFRTAETGRTLVEVYDMSGRNVATLFNAEAYKGEEYKLNFDGTALPNGVYIYRMTNTHETIIEKFMIAK